MVTVNIWHPHTLTPFLPPPPPPAPFLSHKAFSKPVTEDKTNGFSFRPGEKADNDADSKEGGGGGGDGEKGEKEEEEERVTLLDAWMVSAEEGQRVNTCLQVRLHTRTYPPYNTPPMHDHMYMGTYVSSQVKWFSL